MKSKYAITLFLLYIGVLCYGQTLRLDGNAHIFSYDFLKKMHTVLAQTGTTPADELYKRYKKLRQSCGSNEILFEEKRKTEFANCAMKISGQVHKVRKSIFDEYIVELKTNELGAWNIGVVYPKKISQTMKTELMQLRQGDYFEALILTRDTYLYVDVPVWEQNGVYRTEP